MEIRQEREHFPSHRVALFTVGAVAFTAVLVAIAWLIVGASPKVPPRPEHRAEVSGIEMTILPGPRPGLDQHARQRLHLQQYGWTDRDQRLVHIPIDRAMQLYVERQGRGGQP